MNTAKIVLYVLAAVAALAALLGIITFEQTVLAWLGFVALAKALVS